MVFAKLCTTRMPSTENVKKKKEKRGREFFGDLF
jgi:hypothetical protein